MGVTMNNHPLPFFDGNTGVEGSPRDMFGGFAVFLKEGLNILNPLLEEVFIFVFEQKKDFPFLGERERGWDRDVLDHWSLR